MKLIYTLNIRIIRIFSINKDTIPTYNNKDVKFFVKKFIDITIKTSWCIRKIERYYFVFEMTIIDLKISFLFISFSNYYFIINTNKVLLN